MHALTAPSAVDTLEAIYAVDGDDRAWATRILDAVSPSLDRGLGTLCVFHVAPGDDRIEVVDDAEGDARPATVREELRQRVLEIEWARTKGRRRDDLHALDIWQSLLDGRWSLVEQLESDGKRLYVARENAIAGVGPNALLPRERAVLRLAASGLSSKLVAYALGIAASTVSLHLRAAADKIDARTRADLLRLAVAMTSTSAPAARG